MTIRLDPFSDNIDLATHSLNGWPHYDVCSHCGARSALLCATLQRAHYECRGTPIEPKSAYGPDRCGAVYEVKFDG
ncbi:MAG: hypothetical protein NVS3B1_27930 [Marmoricola sp.]